MDPKKLRLAADILEFKLPYSIKDANGTDIKSLWPLALACDNSFCSFELIPGDGYEFISLSESKSGDEVYLSGLGWVKFDYHNTLINSSSLFRRKIKSHPLFGNPPEGYTWHNPDDLTPDQVETGDGWRLCLKDNYQRWEKGTRPKNTEIWINGWVYGVAVFGGGHTYRTKEPLPKTEFQKFEKWAHSQSLAASQPMFEAWKAGKESE